MELVINEKNIHNINLTKFINYHVDPKEFYNVAGKEHYKLLAYLSTKFNDTYFIDIGTHMGSSALALSYNSKNSIYTFDILDKTKNITNSFKSASNIFSIIDDIFDGKRRFIYENLLLNCPFIFIDVDPHNGDMEWNIYNYFLQKEYKGFLLFDDIHHFEGMRNFWKKVDPKYTQDLTYIGHFSGTGLVTFNQDNKVIFQSN